MSANVIVLGNPEDVQNFIAAAAECGQNLSHDLVAGFPCSFPPALSEADLQMQHAYCNLEDPNAPEAILAGTCAAAEKLLGESISQ